MGVPLYRPFYFRTFHYEPIFIEFCIYKPSSWPSNPLVNLTYLWKITIVLAKFTWQNFKNSYCGWNPAPVRNYILAIINSESWVLNGIPTIKLWSGLPMTPSHRSGADEFTEKEIARLRKAFVKHRTNRTWRRWLANQGIFTVISRRTKQGMSGWPLGI